MDIEIEETPVKPKIILNEKAKPKDIPKPKAVKGAVLGIEKFVDSHLYKNFIKYENPMYITEAYMAIKQVYAGMETENQRDFLLNSPDINKAISWADWDIPGWDWSDCFHRCTKNKQKKLAAKKAKNEEQAV